ncbi:hypothetical protein GCM10027271_46010 [Saccharopolyspora gloriosae]|uniref:DUF4913 domain-containing protein n=1 Tax=Saccharopolyspora gloriosae TaxID=455344 RepID=A0A840NIH7_9PSEU|nr:hypothetical protein [Saccharopolyspora gloriosae]MBB5070098.1 hypothetical protein [Saccharopolyspora gloriosae]
MNDDEEFVPRNRPRHDDGAGAAIEALTEIVGGLTAKLAALRGRIETLETDAPDEPAEEENKHDQPASWVLFAPPAAAEDRRHRGDEHTPLWTVRNFVGWYNATFLGTPGSSARAIPPCWTEHPGLAQEVAVLAYSWRRANIGTTANVRDAQLWLQQTRPGFAARLSDWTHSHCFDRRHRPVGARCRPTRFAADAAEQDAISSGEETE